MKKLFITFSIVLLMVGCTTVQTFRTTSINNSESACKNPTFVATVAKTSVEMSNNLSYYALTKWAQSNYGSDVSIQNVFWEVKAGQKINVVFDVVKCGKQTDN